MPKSRPRKNKKAAKPKSKSKSKSKRPSPIPEGFRSVTPYLAINGAAEAIEWYKKTFGAKEFVKERQVMPDGRLMHGRILIGDSIVMMSDVVPGGTHKDPLELGSTPVTLHIYVTNVDEVWNRAVENGATVDQQLDNQFWGERYGQLRDPFGHSWSLSMRVKMSPEELEQKRQQAMSMFAQNQHPASSE